MSKFSTGFFDDDLMVVVKACRMPLGLGRERLAFLTVRKLSEPIEVNEDELAGMLQVSPIQARLAQALLRAETVISHAESKDARREDGESQTFYNEFFNVFGISRRRVATFEEPVKKLGKKRGRIDLFWKGTLFVEQKSAGHGLVKAKEQAFDYFPHLKEEELPRHLLVSDFQSFELHDLDTQCKQLSIVDLTRNRSPG
ncbi:type IIL restriction-modification enzyme MmeI [Hyphomicrobium sp.]|uniref:type IIL restriction-modification enzyme MmeI n=1 Tax=Hyphomicrobium sp. TaxID=82 RepID=UPI0025C5FD12|nr:type IIL restriction-modification enzyme MmeI [Hyphomicrobium sp.]